MTGSEAAVLGDERVEPAERCSCEVRPLVEIKGDVLEAGDVIEDLCAQPPVPISAVVCVAALLALPVHSILVTPARRKSPAADRGHLTLIEDEAETLEHMWDSGGDLQINGDVGGRRLRGGVPPMTCS